MKWVAWRPEVDPLVGTVAVDDRWCGASPADEAALEWALRLARGVRPEDDVVVITVGPPAADAMLRDALACGARSAIRVETGGVTPSSSEVARAIGSVLRPHAPRLVLCGDWSLDRGSGAVPPMLAAELAIAPACGLVTLAADDRAITAQRRLDGGRREVLRITARAVLSVEGATARLRRAAVAAVIASQAAVIDVREPGETFTAESTLRRTMTFRPRARILDGPATDAPARERAAHLMGADATRTPPVRVVADAADAAERILAQLDVWGYELPSTGAGNTPS